MMEEMIETVMRRTYLVMMVPGEIGDNEVGVKTL